MTIKVTYNVTDVYMSQSVSPVYINVSYSDGGALGGGVWGSITGTLSNQTDLQNALNAKFDDPTGTTLQYIDGTGALQTFPLTLPVLQEVRNQTGATLDAGTVVYINGATGNKPTVTKAIATGDATSAQTLGMISAAIANNGVGYVVVIGTCGGLDTSAYTEGQQLYLSYTTAGAVTTTKPYAPNHLVYIGIVTRSHPTLGTIEVRVQNGFEMDEIHNVSAQTPSNNDGLFYNTTTSLWESKAITTALGYTPVPTTRNITINGVTYDLSADRTYTISTGISGSGAAGQVTYWTGASAVSGSNNLFWDNANSRLGIGTNAPATRVDVVLPNGVNNVSQGFRLSKDTGLFEAVNGTSNAGGFVPVFLGRANYDASGLSFQGRLFNNASLNPAILFETYNFSASSGLATGQIILGISNATTRYLNIYSNGNMVLQAGGTFTDGGQRLQVIGDTLLRGSGATSATTALTVQNSSSTNLFTVRNDGNVGIGTASPAFKLDVSGGVRVSGSNDLLTLSGASTRTTFKMTGTAGGYTEVVGNGTDFYFTTNGNTNISFITNNVDRAKIYGNTGNLVLQNGGTFSDVASSRLTINSTTQGFLPPRMTTTEKNAIATPAAGLVVYDTTDNKHYGYDGTTWNAFY